MRILLTGASSFTGYWFARAASSAGHDVTATFRAPGADSYDGVRGRRVAGLADCCRRQFNCPFGGPEFMKLLQAGPWDLLCQHAAEVADYKSPDFNALSATAANTANLRQVLAGLKQAGCRGVVLTGSAFECDEGLGSGGLPAFSPYGLSKALTWQVFRYYVPTAGIALGKFVIPNPFGVLEEPRFTSYLARTWLAGKTASVATPAYVRDNIHVGLLAACYERFCRQVAAGDPAGPPMRLAPTGYAGTQGAFTALFAEQMRSRLGVECRYELAQQKDFPEPHVRINSDLPDAAALGFDERAAWDALAEYYLSAARAGA